MAIFEKLSAAMAKKDFNAYMELMHEDAVVVFHKSGNKFSKVQWGEMAEGMFANEKFVQDSTRCVYENEDILVAHNFMSYPDGTKAAVMVVMMLKDGKIIRSETGATLLS